VATAAIRGQSRLESARHAVRVVPGHISSSRVRAAGPLHTSRAMPRQWIPLTCEASAVLHKIHRVKLALQPEWLITYDLSLMAFRPRSSSKRNAGSLVVHGRGADACQRIVVLMMLAAGGAGCDRGQAPTSPTEQPMSRLTYQVPAATTHGAASGDYTTANATFGANVRTSCVPNPNLAGSVCPDLMVHVQPVNETFCQLWASAPPGETLAVRAYSQAQRGPSAGVAGLDFNCGRGGTTCNWSVGRFTIYELRSDMAGTVTRLHMTFEQTCADYATLRPTGGTLTGEL
jgi:hypothetical protein